MNRPIKRSLKTVREYPGDQPTFKNFGDFLVYHRRRLGLSQEDVEKRTGIDRSYLSMLERKGNPTFQVIQSIAESMGMNVEDFFDVKEEDLEPPVIKVQMEGQDPERTRAIIETEAVPIPIISSENSLRSGKINADDVEAYIMLDRKTLGKLPKEAKLVAMRQSDAIPYPLIIIDMNDLELKEGELFLIDRGIGLRVRKSYASGRSLVLQGVQDDDDKPFVLVGKQKDSLLVLGRVVAFYGKPEFLERKLQRNGLR